MKQNRLLLLLFFAPVWWLVQGAHDPILKPSSFPTTSNLIQCPANKSSATVLDLPSCTSSDFKFLVGSRFFMKMYSDYMMKVLKDRNSTQIYDYVPESWYEEFPGIYIRLVRYRITFDRVINFEEFQVMTNTSNGFVFQAFSSPHDVGIRERHIARTTLCGERHRVSKGGESMSFTSHLDIFMYPTSNQSKYSNGTRSIISTNLEAMFALIKNKCGGKMEEPYNTISISTDPSPFFKGKLFDVPGTITYVNAADYPLRASRILRMHVVKELEKFSKTVASGDTSTGKEVVISKKQGFGILTIIAIIVGSTILLAIAAMIAWFLCREVERRRQREPAIEYHPDIRPYHPSNLPVAPTGNDASASAPFVAPQPGTSQDSGAQDPLSSQRKTNFVSKNRRRQIKSDWPLPTSPIIIRRAGSMAELSNSSHI